MRAREVVGTAARATSVGHLGGAATSYAKWLTATA
jgi:hypothetical protein